MSKPYHHGALASALLDAATEILETEGLEHLTLRAIARRAGVSHMAPAHHFGDLSGLLSELAARGYAAFAASLQRAQAEPGNRTPARASAQAYVAFARAHRGMFLLMFRAERLDFTRPALLAAALEAQRALMQTRGGSARSPEAEPSALSRQTLAGAVFNWSAVHGFAMLLIDGRLDPMIAMAGDWPIETLLDEAFEAGFGARAAS